MASPYAMGSLSTQSHTSISSRERSTERAMQVKSARRSSKTFLHKAIFQALREPKGPRDALSLARERDGLTGHGVPRLRSAKISSKIEAPKWTGDDPNAEHLVYGSSNNPIEDVERVRTQRLEAMQKEMESTRQRILELEGELQDWQTGDNTASTASVQRQKMRKSHAEKENRLQMHLETNAPTGRSTRSQSRTARTCSSRPSSAPGTGRSLTRPSVLSVYQQDEFDRWPLRPPSSTFFRYPVAFPQRATESPGPIYDLERSENYYCNRAVQKATQFGKAKRKPSLEDHIEKDVKVWHTPGPDAYTPNLSLVKDSSKKVTMAKSSSSCGRKFTTPAPGPGMYWPDSVLVQRGVCGPKLGQRTFFRERKHANPVMKKRPYRRPTTPKLEPPSPEHYSLLLSNYTKNIRFRGEQPGSLDDWLINCDKTDLPIESALPAEGPAEGLFKELDMSAYTVRSQKSVD